MVWLALALALLRINSSAALAQVENAKAIVGCNLQDAEDRNVVRVLDGETLVLDGGSELKLVGALAPRAYDAAGEAREWPLADQARLTLERLVAGRGVRVAFAGRRQDRYGRLLGHVFLSATESTWLQGEMLKRGLARAYALEGNAACLAELIGHEAIAREAAIGIWAEPVYSVRSADDTRSLLRLSGTFQIVEGRVLGVSEIRGSIFVNFGEDWRQDFTAILRATSGKQSKSDDAQFVAKDLTGQRIRVRGWVERRGGPMIELPHVAAIEVLAATDGDVAVSAPRAETQPRRRARGRRPADGNQISGE